MYDLASKVLMVDHVPGSLLARYELSKSSVSLVFYPRTPSYIEKHFYNLEILVPTTEDDINWDYELIQMLIQSVDESDTIRNISAESLDDHFAWLDVASCFQENELICSKVVVHPSRAVEMPLLDVHESELCPENKAFFLPPPQFLGVLATRNNKTEFGMSVLNSNFVVCFNFE
jgi:hypothetical protein